MGGLCIDNISASDRLVQLYTGFTDFNTLKLCFDFLGPSICDLQYHNQPKKGTGKGAPRILSPINEFYVAYVFIYLKKIWHLDSKFLNRQSLESS